MPESSGDSAVMAEELKKVLLYAVPSVVATQIIADKIDSGIYRWLDDGGTSDNKAASHVEVRAFSRSSL